MAIGVLFLFGGCSAKEFNEGAKGIANDISKLFEVRE